MHTIAEYLTEELRPLHSGSATSRILRPLQPTQRLRTRHASSPDRPGAELELKNVGLNPRRTALLSLLERMGAKIDVVDVIEERVEVVLLLVGQEGTKLTDPNQATPLGNCAHVVARRVPDVGIEVVACGVGNDDRHS